LRVACFADASFWIALSSRRDQLHRSAIAWRQHLVRSDGFLITTEPVLWEWLNGLADTTTRGVAAEGYRRCHRDTRVEVVSLSGNLIEAAISLYEVRPDKNWSLTDCSSFIVMHERNLTHALTADRHFQQAGFFAALLEDPPESPSGQSRTFR
jgi:predicted nucleic acid-binding protein